MVIARALPNPIPALAAWVVSAIQDLSASDLSRGARPRSPGSARYGSRDERYASRSTISASVRLASTGIISAVMAPLRVPSFMSYICRAR